MVLRTDHPPRNNFFNEFFYDEWVDDCFCGNHSRRAEGNIGEYERLLTHFDDIGSIEASFAICWQQVSSGFFDAEEYPNQRIASIESVKGLLDPSVISEAKSKIEEENFAYRNSFVDKRDSCISLLPDLVKKHRPDVPPDGYVLDRDAIVYVHLAVGHALMLERIEGTRSEGFWERIEDALRIIKTPKTESVPTWYEERPCLQMPVENSMLLIEVLIWSNLFHRYLLQTDYEQALECLDSASVLCKEIWEENSEANQQEGLGVSEWTSSLANNYPAIETLDIGAHLVRFIIPSQKAVEAFENLFEEDPRTTDWERVSRLCRSIGNVWEYYKTGELVLSEITDRVTQPHIFWQVAHGLASQKISPSELMEYQEQIREREAETRLCLYFFGDTWDKLPDKARAALISADREYENTHGRRQGIFEDLWLATREILVEVLLKPYNLFCAAQKEQREIKSLAALALTLSDDKDLEDIVQALYYAPLFEEYLRQTFREDDKEFIKDAEKAFIKLNRLRNDAVHANRPAYKRNSFERDIRETYAEFLGIGRNGILPRLMRLHPVASLNPNPPKILKG